MSLSCLFIYLFFNWKLDINRKKMLYDFVFSLPFSKSIPLPPTPHWGTFTYFEVTCLISPDKRELERKHKYLQDCSLLSNGFPNTENAGQMFGQYSWHHYFLTQGKSQDWSRPKGIWQDWRGGGKPLTDCKIKWKLIPNHNFI